MSQRPFETAVMNAVLSLEELEMRVKSIILDKKSFQKLVHELEWNYNWKPSQQVHPRLSLEFPTVWGSVFITGEK